MILFNAPVLMHQKSSNFQIRVIMVWELQNVEKSRARMVHVEITLALMAKMDMLSFGIEFYCQVIQPQRYRDRYVFGNFQKFISQEHQIRILI